MNIEQARAVLDDLKAQKKEAEDRLTLLSGAVQGAEAVLATLESQAVEEPKEKKKK